jgi:hypothetical protein
VHPSSGPGLPSGEGQADSAIDVHNGIRFRVDAVPQGDLFAGRFTILDTTATVASGTEDSYRPTMDNSWATPNEALTYGIEAAHHAIEGILPFPDGQPQTHSAGPLAEDGE